MRYAAANSGLEYGILFALPTALTAVFESPTTKYPRGIGSSLNRLTDGAPFAWARIRNRGVEELRRDMKNIASAKRLTPAGPFGKRITGRSVSSFIFFTVPSSCSTDLTVEPPPIIAAGPPVSQ